MDEPWKEWGMAKVWKVDCRRSGPGAKGNASGEFSRMADALDFADVWLEAGWIGTLTNPAGQTVELVRGERPVFPRRTLADRRVAFTRRSSH
jgi:hypothetical protein